MKKHSNQFQVPPKTFTKETKKAFESVTESLKSLIPVLNDISNISNSFSKAIEGFSNFNLDDFQKNVSQKGTATFSKLLENSWYVPETTISDLLLLNIDEMNNPNDIDGILIEYLSLTSYPSIKTLDVYPSIHENNDEIKVIEGLIQLGYKKPILLYCIERIENTILEIQLYKNPKVSINRIKVGGSIAEETLNTFTNEQEFSFLFDKNQKLDKSLALFASFKKGLNYFSQYKKYPLNRNLLFHGHIKEEEIDNLLVQKAILAYGFFKAHQKLIIKENK